MWRETHNSGCTSEDIATTIKYYIKKSAEGNAVDLSGIRKSLEGTVRKIPFP